MAIIVYRHNTPEQEARIKAEKERLKRLKITNPEQYKEEISVRRKFLIFIGIFGVMLAGLLIALVLASK